MTDKDLQDKFDRYLRRYELCQAKILHWQRIADLTGRELRKIRTEINLIPLEQVDD